MTPAQLATTHIRQYLARGEASGHTLASVQAGHTAAVQALNDRLDTCGAYLKANLLTEAVHHARIAPNVLDEAAELDFPEREKFAAACEKDFGEPIHAVHENGLILLDEAINRHNELAPVLARYRMLSVGRAPLLGRIRVLRKLSQMDAMTPYWGEDLAMLERERHKELDAALQAAVARKDVPASAAVCDEILGSWLETPSATLRQKASEVKNTVARFQVKAKLEDLEDRVSAAHAAGDVKQTSAAVREWQAGAASIGMSGDTEAIRAAIAWVNETRALAADDAKYAQAQALLERALDLRKPLDQLEPAWNALVRCDRHIPDTLRTRYESMRADVKVEKKRGFQMLLVGIVGGLVLVGAVIATLLFFSHKSAGREKWMVQIKSAVNDGKWDRADEMITVLCHEDPGMNDDPEVKALQAMTTDGIKANEAHAAEFAKNLGAAKAGGPEHPNQTALDTAKRMAVSDAEKAQVAEFEVAVEKSKSDAQAKRDQSIKSALDLLRERYNQVDRNAPDAPAQLDAVSRGINDLIRNGGISPGLLDSIRVLSARVSTEQMDLRLKPKAP